MERALLSAGQRDEMTCCQMHLGLACRGNYCCSSKREPKPNLKQGLKRQQGVEPVGRLSWSLSWWLDPPFSLYNKHTHACSRTRTHGTSAAGPPSPPWAFSFKSFEFPQNTHTHTHTQMLCAKSVSQRDLFLEEEMKKVARDNKSEVVD